MDVVLFLVASACCTAVVLLGIAAMLAAMSRRVQAEPYDGPRYKLTDYRTGEDR